MKCPHCCISIHEGWVRGSFTRHGQQLYDGEHPDHLWNYRSMDCPECKRTIIEVGTIHGNIAKWRQVFPLGASRGPVSPDVPSSIAQDYAEACNVLQISAKASAALSRRCLQNILHAHGYKDRDLAREISLLLNETDPLKALPRKLRETVDAIRNFGNFSAHPLDDRTTLAVIDVEAHEAEWCLEIAEELFEHFYIGPKMISAKRLELDAKLKAAGKPPVR